ncbi:MAG: tripartite tricarboxylate transporter substrate binding protein [Rhizobiales bacterium]|nr:tripartite tricarboxylate transporter substrate binding protein [Hyphomicrobiales bacterium]OJY41982.1 MAG: LacI family transcriptional regulator [Rhizobiales bacterium 64-17]
MTAHHLTRRGFTAVLACTAFSRVACAQSVPAAFPQKPLTLIVPFSAGGPVDVLGRLLAQDYQARSGHAATVENKTGGAGNIGIDFVRKAAPDGTTLLLIPAGNLTINPTLMKSLSFDVERDFAPITLLASAPNIIIASPKLGVKTIADLIALAKTRKISYGSPGVGSQLHLAMELLKEKAGIDLLHVPYRGSTQALNDLLGDHIDLLATNVTAALPALQGKTVVPLAMTTAERSAQLPDVPTLKESGIDGIDVTSWYGLLAPRAVPNDVRDAIFTVTKDILSNPAVQDKLKAQGLTVVLEPPAQFAERIRRETALWAGVIKSRNIPLQ